MSIPAYSPAALAALDVFYTGIIDLNVYVEDEDQENLYEIILNKIIPTNKKFKVFPLSGCTNCINHHNDAANRNIKNRFYLLDKDFTDVLGAQIDSDIIIYLKKYCIENYFFEKDALIEFIIESLPKINRSELSDNFLIDEHISNEKDKLLHIYKLFLLCQVNSLDLANTSLSFGYFTNEKRLAELCPLRIQTYIDSLCAKLEAKGISSNLDDHWSNEILLAFDKLDFHGAVNGKFLMELVFRYIKCNYKIGNINNYSFLYRVAKNCNLQELRDELGVMAI